MFSPPSVFTRCCPAQVFGITKRSKNHTGPQLQTPALMHQSIPAAPIWKPENAKFSVDCPPPPSPPPSPPLPGANRWHLPPPPPTPLSPFYRQYPWFFLTISFICSSFALIFLEPVFTSSDSWLARSRWNAVVLKDLEPKQNMGKCLLCERRVAEMLLSVERWDPRKPTLDKKAAGTAYLSFGGKYLNLKHFLRAEFRRSAWHIEQAPAMFLSFEVTNPSV